MNLNLANRFWARRGLWLQDWFPVTAFLFLGWLTSCAPHKPPPLDGKLNVLVRPPDRTIEPISVEQPGALPVQSGGAMCLDVHLNQPAYVYLVWIDSAGQLIPLYPWNNESLEVKDPDQPPPGRRPAKLIFSPLLGKSWTFCEQVGSETVLLLARRTALPKDMQFGELIRGLPQRTLLEPSEKLVSAQFTESPNSSKGETTGDARLAAYAQSLKSQFELLQIVQFAHGTPASTLRE